MVLTKAYLLVGLVASLTLWSVQSQASLEKDYYTIKEVTIELVSSTEDYDESICVQTEDVPAPTAEINFNDIINIGQQIWKIIENNKPVVNVTVNAGNAVPSGIDNWLQMDSWKPLKSQTYKVSYKNGYGLSVVDFNFRVSYFYGGGVKGRGQYLANVTILPADLSVGWGYTFNAAVKIPMVVNIGSAEQPMAGMQVDLNWAIDTFVKHEESSLSFFVYGDGRLDVHSMFNK